MGCRASSKGFSAEEPTLPWLQHSTSLHGCPAVQSWRQHLGLLLSVLQSSRAWLVHPEKQTNSLLSTGLPNYFVKPVLSTPNNSRILWAPDCLSCFCRCCYCLAATGRIVGWTGCRSGMIQELPYLHFNTTLFRARINTQLLSHKSYFAVSFRWSRISPQTLKSNCLLIYILYTYILSLVYIYSRPVG